MNENETVLYTMKHELKRSRYFLSLFNYLDIGIWIFSGIVCFLFFTKIILSDIQNELAIFLIASIALYILILVIATSIPIEIFHNGLGIFICYIRFKWTQENIVWGGVNYGIESIQTEEISQKEAKKARRERK